MEYESPSVSLVGENGKNISNTSTRNTPETKGAFGVWTAVWTAVAAWNYGLAVNVVAVGAVATKVVAYTD